jgi:hypothetical protein
MIKPTKMQLHVILLFKKTVTFNTHMASTYYPLSLEYDAAYWQDEEYL